MKVLIFPVYNFKNLAWPQINECLIKTSDVAEDKILEMKIVDSLNAVF